MVRALESNQLFWKIFSLKDFKILDENIGTRIQRDLDNSAALEDVHPRDYPHDIYLNGDQYYEWMNEMIDTYASRNPDNQSRDLPRYFLHNAIWLYCRIPELEWTWSKP